MGAVAAIGHVVVGLVAVHRLDARFGGDLVDDDVFVLPLGAHHVVGRPADAGAQIGVFVVGGDALPGSIVHGGALVVQKPFHI